MDTQFDISALHDAIAAVCPIVGLAGPVPTAGPGCYPGPTGDFWRLDFDATSTGEQQAAGVALLLNYVLAAPARVATAKQVRYALNDLGVRAAWDTAVAAANQQTQDYWTTASPIPEDNAKVAKLCAKVGITPAALFDKAVTE